MKKPSCPYCGDRTRKHGVCAKRGQRYQCVSCLKISTRVTAPRLARRQRLKQHQQLSLHLRQARTLVEYARHIDPHGAQLIARSSFFSTFVRQEELAHRRHVSIHRIRQMVRRKQVETLHLGRYCWVTDQMLLST